MSELMEILPDIKGKVGVVGQGGCGQSKVGAV